MIELTPRQMQDVEAIQKIALAGVRVLAESTGAGRSEDKVLIVTTYESWRELQDAIRAFRRARSSSATGVRE